MLYSENPTRGQRWAAAATRAKFKLKTFSHTTLGRAFKAFEEFRRKDLEGMPGADTGTSADAGAQPGPAPKSGAGDGKAPAQGARRFPSVGDTAKRRMEMAGFLRAFSDAIAGSGVEGAARRFVKYWHGKSKRLLL
jgi:hypothetical protein